MNFLSDNAYGVAPDILAALSAANEGAAASYGADPLTARLQRRMSEVFERDVAAFPVGTGTAANALAIATLCPQHGAVLCHTDAHIVTDECGAVEFFTHGAQIVTVAGAHAKLAPDAVERTLRRFDTSEVHHARPAVISITQSTERGTLYSLDEISGIADVAKTHGLKLHMDGARFANALASLRCTPAEASWKRGVDVLSFGATKNGAFAAEAVVFFRPQDARDFAFRRMKGGHLLSKMRFVSAQLLAYLENDLWLKNATRANELAARLSAGLSKIPQAEIVHPVEANAVFVRAPDAMLAAWRARGVNFLDWVPSEKGHTVIRLVLSFATPEADVERFLQIACT